MYDPANWPRDSYRKLWQHHCYQKFWWFVMIAGGAAYYMRDNPKDADTITREFHGELIDWFQNKSEEWWDLRARGEKRIMKLAVVVFRFGRKTLIITKLSNLWQHLHDPDQSTVLVSEDVRKAEKMHASVQAIEMGQDKYAQFTYLYGNWKDSQRPWLKGEHVHAARTNMAIAEPSFMVASVNQGLTSFHPDRVDIDDPISEEKLAEEGNWLETVNRGVAAMQFALRSDSMLVVTCTRKRDNDVIGNFLPKEKVRSWTGQENDDERIPYDPVDGEWDVFFYGIEDDNRESIVPNIRSTKQLRQKEEADPVGYAAEYLNRPAIGVHVPLTLKQVEQCYVTKEQLGEDFFNQCMYLGLTDHAFKRLKNLGKGDDSVFIVVAYSPVHDGTVTYIEGFGNNLYRSEDYTAEVIKLLQRYAVQRRRWLGICQEQVSDADSWFPYLRTACASANVICPPTIELQRGPKDAKKSRVRNMAPYWASGLVRLIRGAPGVETLVSQVIRGEFARHDDWADAFADAFHPDVYQILELPRAPRKQIVPISPGDDMITGMGGFDDILPQRTLRVPIPIGHEDNPDYIDTITEYANDFD